MTSAERRPATDRLRTAPNDEIAVAVVGMGYVGMTLAAVLATAGFRVYGVETNPAVVEAINAGHMHLFEPGVEDALAAHIGQNWTVAGDLPERPDVAVICVGTPLAGDRPNLDYLRAATAALADRVDAETLVVVRSTVPVGTTRTLVRDVLAERHPGIRVAHCPERTIQGQALREIRELPQVIGPVDDGAREAAEAFMGRFVSCIVPVSSSDASELVKLVNNAHTDVIYGFGNEVAMVAGELGLDPLEVIRAANVDYPRPDLAKPGFVGGGCLTKDPYILIASLADHDAPIVAAARRLNEAMPIAAAEGVLGLMQRAGVDPRGARVLVCGFAYKGSPPTDDTRGTAATEVCAILGNAGATVVGHDFLVPPQTVRAMGAEPVSLAEGFRDASAVVVLIDHPDYKSMDLQTLLASARQPVVLYDAWRLFREYAAVTEAVSEGRVTYGGLGTRA